MEEDKLNSNHYQQIEQRMATEEATCVLQNAEANENGWVIHGQWQEKIESTINVKIEQAWKVISFKILWEIELYMLSTLDLECGNSKILPYFVCRTKC